MKQNLMQKQLKASTHKYSSLHPQSKTEDQQLDLTSKAFFITRELLQTKYAFSKRALATYLQGKAIILHQKNNQQPPSVLKGYMYLLQVSVIEPMIEVMINLNVLKEEKVTLKHKSTKRLSATTKYDWNIFPKVIVKVKLKIPSENPNKITNEGNLQKNNQKLRLSLFLQGKTVLAVNEQKSHQQMRMKNQRQKQEEEVRKRQEQERKRHNQLIQMSQIDRKKKEQVEMMRKQEQKKNYHSQMNSFWLKERQKIQEFVCPKTDISILESPNIKRTIKSKQQLNQKSAIQAAGHALQMQMKQLKEKQEQTKNPIKPIVSWSFMKKTLGIQNSQSQKEHKSNPKKINPNFNQIQQKNQGISLSVINQTNSQYGCNEEKKIEQITNMKSPKNIPAKSLSYINQSYERNRTPFLKQANEPKMQKEERYDNLSLSDSTQVTQTNYKINKNQNKQRNINQTHNSPIQKQNHVFAKNPEQSMFSNNYYSSGRRSTESIPEKNYKYRKYQRQQLQKPNNHNFFQPFSFKRPSTVQEGPQQTVTIVKKPSLKTSSFQQLQQVMRKSPEQPCIQASKKSILKIKQSEGYNNQTTQTKTMVIPKKTQQRNSLSVTKKVIFCHEHPKTEFDRFSQTITTPQPLRKNKKTSTNDLRSHAQTQYYGQIKRDSFVQELIAEYFKRK